MGNNEVEYLDEEERELIESIENTPVDQFKPASPERVQKIIDAARNYAESHQTRMNNRISTADLERIKMRAAREVLKYQSLVKSVLHKYVTGQLVEHDRETG